MNEKKTHIIKDIAQSFGTKEGSRIYVITTIHSGKTEVVIDHTVSKRMPIQEYEKALEMYEKLNSTPRKCVELEDIINFMHL